MVWLVFSFSLIYYKEGNELDKNVAFPAFGHALSKNEALYFTVGILTTAGTGNLSAGSRAPPLEPGGNHVRGQRRQWRATFSSCLE